MTTKIASQFLQTVTPVSGAAGGRIFYPRNSENSGITNDLTISSFYKVASTAPSPNAQSDLVITTSATTGVTVGGQGFATASGEPNVTSIPAGTGYRHIYASINAGSASIQTNLLQYQTTGNIATTGAQTNISFALNGTAQDTIVRSSGSFITDGFTAGALVTVTGAANAGNNKQFTIASLTATVLTLITVNVVVAEAVGNSITITTKEKLLRSGSTGVFSDQASALQFITYTDGNAYTLATDDRILFKWFVTKESGSGARTVTINTEGNAFASYIQTTIPAVTGPPGISWAEVTGTSQAALVNSGYIANNAGLCTITLPAVAAVGSIVEVAGDGAGGWRVAQNAGQLIRFGTSTTTTGVTGSLSSLARYDCIRLLCITANTDWVVLSSVGNLTVV